MRALNIFSRIYEKSRFKKMEVGLGKKKDLPPEAKTNWRGVSAWSKKDKIYLGPSMRRMDVTKDTNIQSLSSILGHEETRGAIEKAGGPMAAKKFDIMSPGSIDVGGRNRPHTEHFYPRDVMGPRTSSMVREQIRILPDTGATKKLIQDTLKPQKTVISSYPTSGKPKSPTITEKQQEMIAKGYLTFDAQRNSFITPQERGEPRDRWDYGRW